MSWASYSDHAVIYYFNQYADAESKRIVVSYALILN